MIARQLIKYESPGNHLIYQRVLLKKYIMDINFILCMDDAVYSACSRYGSVQ